MSVVPSLKALLSSQVTLRASRPFLADQKSFASTATPFWIATTSTTPATAFAPVASKDLTVVPKRGGWATRAVSMPGSFTSLVNWALPLILGLLSWRGDCLPM